MNLSGGSVLAARDFFKIATADLLVICDDFNLPLGKLRMRGSGSAGGQKGLANIIVRLGSQDISRLRIGVGTPPDGYDAADFVLSKFRKEEVAEIEVAQQLAADAVQIWAVEGLATAMNKYN
jgi:PTH1 family peptidyl-tRNA hydrolase